MNNIAPIKAFSTTMEMEAPFFDVDSCDVVWHGNYAKYFEVARCKLLDNIGYNYNTMRDDGFFFPIIKMQTKYIKPLLFGQVFLVTATIIEWENRLKINYLVHDKVTGNKLTEAQTTQAAVNMQTQEMQFECPEKFLSIMRKLTS